MAKEGPKVIEFLLARRRLNRGLGLAAQDQDHSRDYETLSLHGTTPRSPGIPFTRGTSRENTMANWDYVMLCYVMLCYVMLCYVMLCYVMFCYVVLCVLCYVMLCCGV